MYLADSTAYVSSPTGMQVYTTGAAISGTSNPTLLQSGRAGQDIVYTLSVPNGTYTVTVMIAPTSAAVLGYDGEDIYIQGQKVGYCYWSLDPACTSQQRPFTNTAAQASFPASVTDGTLRLNVEGSYGGQAILSAIKVAQVGASPTAVSMPVALAATPTPVASTATPAQPGNVFCLRRHRRLHHVRRILSPPTQCSWALNGAARQRDVLRGADHGALMLPQRLVRHRWGYSRPSERAGYHAV
jgi:hypothetical protein